MVIFLGGGCLAGPVQQNICLACWHEPFRALCDVPAHLKLVWDGTSDV